MASIYARGKRSVSGGGLPVSASSAARLAARPTSRPSRPSSTTRCKKRGPVRGCTRRSIRARLGRCRGRPPGRRRAEPSPSGGWRSRSTPPRPPTPNTHESCAGESLPSLGICRSLRSAGTRISVRGRRLGGRHFRDPGAVSGTRPVHGADVLDRRGAASFGSQRHGRLGGAGIAQVSSNFRIASAVNRRVLAREDTRRCGLRYLRIFRAGAPEAPQLPG